MRYNQLGQSDLKVSELCLGSVTWGAQNTTAEGHQQIDLALDHGVNMIDTAEVYPGNPMSAETTGDSERVIGEWIAKSAKRKDILIATKISGAGNTNIRDGAPISRKTVKKAVEGSLRLLQTDYIDLYQLHWPNRGSYMFRQHWEYNPTVQNKSQTLDHMLETLEALQEMVDAGKIRYVGLSNESAWGSAQWLRISEQNNLPRMISIQNEYSLLCRLFDTDLAELSHNEEVGLLAYSALATGLLTGKYQDGAIPEGSRLTVSHGLGGRMTPRVWPAIDAYLKIAEKHGLDPSQMALAWSLRRPFMASIILGATNLNQLENSLQACDLTLSDEVMSDILLAYKAHPMPY